MTIIYLTLAWVAGMWCAFYVADGLPYGIVALIIGAVFAFIWPYQRRQWTLGLAIIGIFLFGAARLESARPINSANHIAQLNNQGYVSLYGIVTDEPDEQDTYTNLRVEINQVEALGEIRAVHGLVLVRFPPNSKVAYGDRILAAGELREPPTLDTFDYAEKLAREGIFSYMLPDRTRILDHGHGDWYRDWLIEVKKTAKTNIEKALNEPQASLLSGILLGDDRGMPFGIKDAFNATGTSHVIAISGFNMAIIAGIISGLFNKAFKSKWLAFFLSLIAISTYTIFVGADGAVVRAAVMSLVVMIAPLLNRKSYVPAALAFTAFVMTLLDPWVLWDIGFQLSFAAVLGMALLVPVADRWFQTWMRRSFGEQFGTDIAGWLSEPLVVGIVAQIFTLPIILFYFGRLSLVSPLVNLLIVPIQSLILFWGGAATLVSFVSPMLGEFLFRGTWLFLSWTTFVVRRFAESPIASVEFSLPQWAFIGSLGLVLIMTILNATRPPWYEQWSKQLRLRGMIQIALPALGIILLATLFQRIANQPTSELKVTYLDMGQSNSVLIQSPDGAVFLIDGGRFPSRLLTALGDHLPPNQRQIDILWITSDKRDDIGGLIDIVKRYDVKTVITGVQSSQEQVYYDLLAELVQQDIPILQAEEGWQIETGDGVKIEILAPLQYKIAPDNMVLRLEYGEAIFLFTNELSASGEELLIQDTYLTQATVLQAADHAADKSNSEKWINAVNPQVVIVQNDPSSFEAGAIGHVIARFDGRELFRTDQHGEITITTDGSRLEVETQ